MLPILSLDDQMFSEITENARKLIKKYAKSWTDYNAHDPGITLIELFAWLKELQQYHLDQIGSANRLKYLKLFGMELKHKSAANTYVKVKDIEGKTLILPEGTPFLAGDISFENEERYVLSKRKILCGFSKSEEGQVNLPNADALESGKMQFYIFGKAPKQGAEFYLCFNEPFKVGIAENFYIDLFEEYDVKRNPIKDGFSPLAQLKWSYFSGNAWREIEKVQDDTEGFLQSGRVCLTVDNPMQKSNINSEGYFIKVAISVSDYDVAPIVTGINSNVVKVMQQKSLSVCRDFNRGEIISLEHNLALCGYIDVYIKQDKGWIKTENFEKTIDEGNQTVRITLLDHGINQSTSDVRVVCYDQEFAVDSKLGTGDGFPYQSFESTTENVMYDGFEIIAQNENGIYEDWKKVDSFDSLTPSDKCYIFSEEKGLLYFGDCENGMAPEGEIRIVSCRVSLGKDGNVKEGKIDSIGNPFVNVTIESNHNAEFGEDAETIDDCFMRLRKELYSIKRAVTFSDYETLAKNTPGLMIKSCKTIPASKLPKRDGSIEGNCVTLVVQPYTGSEMNRLNPTYMKNIYDGLREKQLIGTKLNILSPEYAGIVIFAEISVKSYYRNAKEEINAAVSHFFTEAWDFGKPVQYSSIYGIIDTLDCVVSIGSLVIDAQGKGIKRSINGDVLLPPNGIAYLKEADLVISEVE